MRNRDEITADMCRTLIEYNASTGTFIWKRRLGSDPRTAYFNRRFEGKQAFTATHTEGYKVGTIYGRTYRAHRVAWAIAHGAWPDIQIDHINGDKADNRLCNLREVDNQSNQRNVKLTRNNTSGICGVNLYKGRWIARITVNRRMIHLGSFPSPDAAAAVRRKAEQKYGFTKMHGTR